MYKINYIKDFENILEISGNAACISDPHGTIILITKKAISLFGDTLEAIDVTSIEQLSYALSVSLKKLFVKGNIANYEAKLILEDKIQADSKLIHTHDETMFAITLFQRPGADRQNSFFDMITKLLNTIESTNQKFQDGYWITNAKGQVIGLNSDAGISNRVSKHRALGMNVDDFVKLGIINKSVTTEVLKRRTGVTFLQTLNSGIKMIATGIPLFDNKGNIELVVVSDHEVNDLNAILGLPTLGDLSLQQPIALFKNLNKIGIQIDEIIIVSPAMQKILERALRVAVTDTSLLIQGESGTGKSIFAKLIHLVSKRGEQPFVRIDCASIPDTLLESELFGYEKGAFTGAKHSGKIGQLQLGDKGTIFLDEIGDIPLNLQAKLLRFLEDGKLMRVGGIESIKINARIIAATNKNLKKMVKDNLFRQDLFFRLSVVPLNIPPLRSRPEEIEPLVHHFLDKFNKHHNMDITILSDALSFIENYSFPGNVRELSNLIERLVVLSAKNYIGVKELKAHLSEFETHDDLNNPFLEWNLKKAVSDFEIGLIKKAIKTFKIQKKAALHLGIDQSTLSKKLNRDSAKYPL